MGWRVLKVAKSAVVERANPMMEFEKAIARKAIVKEAIVKKAIEKAFQTKMIESSELADGLEPTAVDFQESAWAYRPQSFESAPARLETPAGFA
jgi:hypothetical protein